MPGTERADPAVLPQQLQAIKQVVVAAADTGADVVQSAAVEREVFGSLWGGPASTQAIGARQKQQQ